MFSPRFLPSRAAGSALLVAAVGLLAAPAHAGFENFDQYTAGTAIAGLNGGVDWNAAWRSNANANATVSDESITYSLAGRTLGGGNSLKVMGNADDALVRWRYGTADTSGTDYFVSFLFRLEGKSAGTVVTGNVFAGWQAEDGNPAIAVDNIGYLGGGGLAGARVNNLSTPITTPLVYGRTYRFVIKYTGWDGARYSTTQVWLDPNEDDENSTDPALTQTRTVPTGGSSGFRGLRVRTLGLSATAYYLIDDLHVTTSWDELLNYPDVPDEPGAGDPDGYVITPGPDWAPYEHSLEIAPGGVFDYSHLLDAPAGKYGALRVTADGHFEFTDRPGERVRFAGVNLNYSAQFLSDADADHLAETLARSGYNTVRLHHFDGQLRAAGGHSYDIDPAKLERLDYLFHALKQRGLYLSIDLYSTRGFSAAEIASFGLTGSSISANTFKALVPLDENAYESWRRYTETLLTHVNPYTGLSWAEDPALIGICPVNEDNLYNHYTANATVRDRYEQAFNLAYPPAGETTAERDAKRYRFLLERHAASDARLQAYVRSLGTKALLTGTNYGAAQGLTYQRFTYDYVDNHSYFNHPTYPGSGTVPLNGHNDSLVRRRVTMPRDVMTTRIFGKPFTVTEWLAARPNQYRAEATLVMPAYASLQDWDGLWAFQYGDTRDMVIDGGVSGAFAVASDPIGLISSRLTSLLFQRGDIAPGRNAVVWAVRPEEAFLSANRAYSSHFLFTGLISQVGSLPGQPAELADGFDAVVTSANPAPAAPLPDNGYLVDNETLISRMISDGVLPTDSLVGYGETARTTSDTGEILMDAGLGIATVVTPRSELFVLTPNAQLTGERVAISNGETPGTVAVITLDAEPGEELTLAAARRILVTHLTDALPTGTRFDSVERKQLQSWGQLPQLVLRGSATMALHLPEGGWAAWVVDSTGARVRPHPLTLTEDGIWTMQVSTVEPEGVQLAYELERITPPAPRLLSAESRKVHGSSGPYAIPVQVVVGAEPSPTELSVECRVGSELTLVLTFNRPIADLVATVTAGSANLVNTTITGPEVILHLNQVSNAQTLVVSLADVTTPQGGVLSAATLPLGVLVGDINGDGAVTMADVEYVRGLPGAARAVSEDDFRCDIDANGTLHARDFAHVRSRVGQAIP